MYMYKLQGCCYRGNRAKLGSRHGSFGSRWLQVSSETKYLMCPCAGVQLPYACPSLDSGWCYKATRKMTAEGTITARVCSMPELTLVRSKPLGVQGFGSSRAVYEERGKEGGREGGREEGSCDMTIWSREIMGTIFCLVVHRMDLENTRDSRIV